MQMCGEGCHICRQLTQPYIGTVKIVGVFNSWHQKSVYIQRHGQSKKRQLPENQALETVRNQP